MRQQFGNDISERHMVKLNYWHCLETTFTPAIIYIIITRWTNAKSYYNSYPHLYHDENRVSSKDCQDFIIRAIWIWNEFILDLKLFPDFKQQSANTLIKENGPDAASHTPHVGLCKGKAAVTSSIHPLNRIQCNIGWIQTYLYKFSELYSFICSDNHM